MAEIQLGIEGLGEPEEVGRRGSAWVYRAEQLELNRTVAVKVLTTPWDEAVQRRFERERQAVGALSDDPGVVGVHQTSFTATGEPYLMMPYYPNGSLDQIVKEGGTSWERACSLMSTVAETMADAHELGIFHRDLKPANILLDNRDRPVISDFGISRLSSSETASQSSELTFTPAHSRPEAFETSKATPAADVYGLGATLRALIAGSPPFTAGSEAPSVLEIMMKVVNSEMGAPSQDTPARLLE